MKTQKGFTLIEILVVIGILAVLFAIVLVAINPARQFAQANDTKRKSDINAILNGINQYMADHKGVLPAGTAIDQTVKEIGNDAGQVDLCADLVPTYIASLPMDPTRSTGTACIGTYSTGYTVTRSATNNRITVAATGEIDTTMTVTR